MTESKNTKHYDLEERTQRFARGVIAFVGTIPNTPANVELTKQVIRSAGSVGANYIEANEAISKRDFAVRVKICRKEAKESRYWLSLLELQGDEQEKKRQGLANEATEIMKIFGAIVQKVE